MRRAGLTLIELVVVVAILGTLAALSLGAIQRARFAALRVRCQNNLRQSALGVLGYEAQHGHLPPGAVSGPYAPLGVPDGVGHGLWPVVLSHLGEDALARRYRWNVSPDDNAEVTAVHIAVLTCPFSDGVARSDFGPPEVNPFWADIGLMDPASSFGSALPVNGAVRLNDILDGASSTMLLAEAPGANRWAAPAMVSIRTMIGDGRHGGGAHAAMADGSVRHLGPATTVRELGRLATRAGGD